MTTTEQRHQPVTLAVPASAARLAAEYLFQSVRDSQDAGEPHTAEILQTVAVALHSAGWDVAL